MTKWQIYDICVNALSWWGEVGEGGVETQERGVIAQEKKVGECRVKKILQEY